LDDALERFGKFFPFRRQAFTVATPWRIEFHEPDFITINNKLFEILIGQFHYRTIVRIERERLGNKAEDK